MNDAVKVQRDGAILEVTLDRPKANAIDVATSVAMGEVFIAFRDDPDLRVAILTGGGEKFFCAGWDLKAAAEGEAYDADYGPGGFGGITELHDLNKPVIAAVNGLRAGRLRRPDPPVRSRQAGDRRGQRPRRRRRLRAGARL